MMDLPSILGGLAQGFVDFGKSAVDLFGTGGAAVGDAVESLRTGKVTTKNQDDFRKWLYGTDSVEDAAAKGLGTALNGVQTVTDYIPGIGAVTRNPLFNAGQGALGGLADEFKTYGKDYDLARAGQRAAVSAGSALAGGGLAEALKGSGNAILKSSLAQGAARGGLGGAITGGGYAAIDGGDAMQGALQGAKMGALIGGATGAIQDFKPAKTYDVALTDDERAARIANAQKQIDDIGPVSLFSNNPDDIAKRARISELQSNIRAYENGYDTAQDYADAMAARRANNRQPTTAIDGTQQAQDYMMAHRPTQSGAYGYDITAGGEDAMMPADAYNNLSRYTGFTEPKYLDETAAQLNAARNNPDAEVTIYRATPGDAINDGDWVTLSRAYADTHNNTQLGGKGNILEQRVPARDIQFAGDDLMEWGYFPQRKSLDATLADADMAVNNPKLTPEQEAYFKDSVVRDENGNLMPLYHGSNSKFTVFDSNKGGQSNGMAKVGHWFTPSEEGAEKWAGRAWWGDNDPTVYETYLNIKKPMVYEPVDNSAQIKKLETQLKQVEDRLNSTYRGSQEYYDAYKEYNNIADEIDNLSYTDPYEQFRSQVYAMEGKTPSQANAGGVGMVMNDEDAAVQKYIDKLKSEGYDGIIIKGTGYDQNVMGGPNDQYVVFDSNQIKDINNLKPTDAPSIMESRIAPEEAQGATPQYKRIYHGTNATFTDFDEKLPSVWFTDNADDIANTGLSNRGGKLNIMERDLPSDLKLADWDLADKYTKQQLIDRGYDGIAYDGSGASGNDTYYEIFNPNKTLKKVNKDTHYSKAAPSQSLEKTLSNGDFEINRVGSANVAPVDPATLPESIRAVKGYIDKDYIKDIEKYAGKKYADISDSELLDYALSKRKPEDRDIMRVAYEDMIKGGSSARKIAENTAKNNYLSAIGETEYSDASGDGLMEYLLSHGNQIGSDSRTKAADIELSDRLGIAPGNTFMRDNANPYDSYGSYSPYDTTISIGDKTVGENAIGTIGHERLHSFQTEALMNRYDKEVLDAYRDLSKDLDKYIKNDAEIAKLHADDPDLAYWGNKDEQQARMLQQYLENKRFTNTGGIRNRAKEWGNEINPAFDKFFDKLRDLSKRGIALPALTALFGGGAYMASQNNDKEKEVK